MGALHEVNRVESSRPKLTRVPTGKARVRLLYEEYIHLPWLRRVWDNPQTESPVLEPVFAAALHGIELAFLMLAEFVGDMRTYVSKRPRIERVADDIIWQCKLLTEVIDAELEEEGTHQLRLSLTQPFPFEGCPPTTTDPCPSPGLARLIRAVSSRVASEATPADRNSLVKLVLNLSAALRSLERWSVGLGFEPQLDALRGLVGLPPQAHCHTLFLDYGTLVQPWVCEQTLTAEAYHHAEDWFFRTVHLGTECWAYVALARLASAAELAAAASWHGAAARLGQATRILGYLGDHLLLLTSMNLRDYLVLKVELEGTSGEGSVQVKSLRPTALKLFEPLAAELLGRAAVEGDEVALQQALLEVYEWPDRHSGEYNYAKALEDLETGLLGGFFYKHFCLAANVIGSDARGTMRMSVQALKRTYETPLFPQLDSIRSLLGSKIDAELAHVKGRINLGILEQVQARGTAGGAEREQVQRRGGQGDSTLDPGTPSGCPFERSGSGSGPPSGPPSGCLFERSASGSGPPSVPPSGCPCEQSDWGGGSPASPGAARGGGGTAGATTTASPTGGRTLAPPVGHQPLAAGAAGTEGELALPAGGSASISTSTSSTSVGEPARAGSRGPISSSTTLVSEFEARRRQLYSWEGVPPVFRQEVEGQLRRQAAELGLATGPGGELPLAFLDHAWGPLAPLAQHRAWMEAAALCQLGNSYWDVLFGRVMPTAAGHVLRLLGLPQRGPTAPHVHFGANSHELVGRLLSLFWGRRQQARVQQRGAEQRECGAPGRFAGEQGVHSRAGVCSGGQAGQGQAVQPLLAAQPLLPARHAQPVRVLCSDTEFYSLTRSLNRLVEAGLAEVEVLPAEPVGTFPARCTAATGAAAAAGLPVDIVIVSQVTYLAQQTLVPSIPELARGVREAVAAAAAGGQSTAAAAAGSAGQLNISSGAASGPTLPAPYGDARAAPPPPTTFPVMPLVVVDAYHGFAALPTDLSEASCCYLGGLLKHAGCGANAAFVVTPPGLDLRPVLTGWLADPSVLAPGSAGILIGSEVGYDPGLALQGATPAYALPLLVFNHLMALWQQASPPLDVLALHAHVLWLHRRFLCGLAAQEAAVRPHPAINLATLVAPAEAPVRSHTLAFRQADARAARAAVEGLAASGIQIDSRKEYVRVGWGPNHSAADCDRLLAALAGHADTV